MTAAPHQSVLYEEIIHALQPASPGRYIDGTVGAGGHARGILEACTPDGCLLGLDIDPEALALAGGSLAPYGPRVTLAQASYALLLEAMRAIGWQAADGIVLDLGVSSMQLDSGERGFSFQRDAALDMRFNPESGFTAAQLVNDTTEAELTEILFKFGQEPRARSIARLIARSRPIHTTTELADLVKRRYPGHSRMHPATRTFQALRIAVNDELSVLEAGLPRAVEALRPGGRLAVISFHSLEDRAVKSFLRHQSHEEVNPPYTKIYTVERKAILKEINRKPIVPGQEEIRRNPRARSAKLRIAEKL